MLGSPISDYDWNRMRRAQNDFAASKLGHPVDESQIKVGYGDAIPGAGADSGSISPGYGDTGQPALAGLMRGMTRGSVSPHSSGGDDWTSPFGGDRYLASTAHELAATRMNSEMDDLKNPYAKADVARANKTWDMQREAQTKNDIDAGPGQDMAIRALQRQIHGMGMVDEEKGREYWAPMNQSARQQGINDKLDLQQPLTDRAAMGADAKVKAAVASADAKIREAQMRGDAATVTALTAARAKLLTSQYGDTDAQTAEMDRLATPLNGLLNAAGNQNAVGTFPPDVEAKIAAYVKAGATRADSIAHLKSTGAIK